MEDKFPTPLCFDRCGQLKGGGALYSRSMLSHRNETPTRSSFGSHQFIDVDETLSTPHSLQQQCSLQYLRHPGRHKAHRAKPQRNAHTQAASTHLTPTAFAPNPCIKASTHSRQTTRPAIRALFS